MDWEYIIEVIIIAAVAITIQYLIVATGGFR